MCIHSKTHPPILKYLLYAYSDPGPMQGDDERGPLVQEPKTFPGDLTIFIAPVPDLLFDSNILSL